MARVPPTAQATQLRGLCLRPGLARGMSGSLGGAGVRCRCAGGGRSLGSGGVRVGTVLFTAHVDVTTFFANQVQGCGCKDDESHNQFPHVSFSSIKKKALRGGKAQNLAPEWPRVAYSHQSPA